MMLKQIDPNPVHETDNATIYTAMTPPETLAADDPLDDLDRFGGAKSTSSSVPWPGYTFIIRSIETGQVITLHDGQIVLAPPGGGGSIHWRCMETKGWLGFQNVVSGKYLGHDKAGRLHCSADRHLLWEYFCVRAHPEGGYVLLLTHWERLWHVGIKEERGMEKLAKLADGGSGGTLWEFVKIEST